MPTKICSKCGLSKSVDQFSQTRSSSDGLSFYCKECDRKRRNDRNRKNRIEYAQTGFPDKVTAKVCSLCKQEKSASDFRRNNARRDGLCTECKTCHKERSSISIPKLHEKNKLRNQTFDYSVERMLRCGRCGQIKSSRFFSKSRIYTRGYAHTCKVCLSVVNRQRTYGITSDFVETLLKRQNRRCAICDKVFKEKFCIDHDHKTKTIRGLLCLKCNSVLGLADDSSIILRSAASYLEQSSAKERTDVA